MKIAHAQTYYVNSQDPAHIITAAFVTNHPIMWNWVVAVSKWVLLKRVSPNKTTDKAWSGSSLHLTVFSDWSDYLGMSTKAIKMILECLKYKMVKDQYLQSLLVNKIKCFFPPLFLNECEFYMSQTFVCSFNGWWIRQHRILPLK